MDIVRFLIDRGADVDSTKGYSGWTALHLAAFWDHEETVRILIEQGATVDIISAVLLDDIARVGQLLDETPERAVTRGNSDGPPLHYAVSPDDVATMLIRHGATLDTNRQYGQYAARVGTQPRRSRPIGRQMPDRPGLGSGCMPAGGAW